MTRVRALLPHLLILAVALGLRVHGLNWDDGAHLHPDERFIAMVSNKINLPSSIEEYFDTARSPLNPYNNGFDGFAYGMLPLFVGRLLGDLLGFGGYDRIVLLGRALSALAEVGTTAFVMAIAGLVYGRRAALLAGALSALTVLSIQLSHFYAFDTFTTFFTAWTLYFAYRVWLRGGSTSAILLGVGAGFAIASKISAVLLVPIVVVPCLLPRPPARLALAPRAGTLAIALIALLVSFRVAEPYAFTGLAPLDFLRPNQKYIVDKLNWIKVSSGEAEVPYMIQWADTPRYTFAIGSIVRWGLGPAAALAAFAGLVVAAVRLRRWGWDARHLLLVIWALLNLAYFGGQFAKFMRYLLPVYPALIVLAGFSLAGCWSLAARYWRQPGNVARLAGLALGSLPALVVVATACWALAFSAIYEAPNSRIAASRWMIDTLPRGATLGVEHWDDALPLPLPGKDARGFRDVSMNLYDEESPEKLRKLLDNLNRVDYLVLSSNRLSGSIPRLPRRYPLATEYYRALFDGRLGFELVAEFTSRPVLLGHEVVDDSAQEDFTVYDHPRVLIFGKSPGFSPALAQSTLGAVSLGNVQRTKAIEGNAPREALLTSDEWQLARTSGTWSDLFDRDDLANSIPGPVWWLAASLLGLLAWPLVWRLFPHLPDRGYSFARVVGLLLLAYPAWLLASLKWAPFGRVSLLAAALLLTAISVLALRGQARAWLASIRRRWRFLVLSELVALAAFLFLLALRALNPDLWHPSYGGEKPMDFAFLNAIAKSQYFPPYDPWFAGGSINYYYFGFVLVAALVKLTGILPAVAYNLALALWFALIAQAVFGLAAGVAGGTSDRLRRSAVAAGPLALLFVLLIGNLDGGVQLRDALWKLGKGGLPSGLPLVTGVTQILAGLAEAARGKPLAEFDFWRSTRFIGPEEPGPIHEFPYFTFLYGDLHAHLLSVPLTLVAAALGLELARSSTLARLLDGPLSYRWPRRGEVARLLGLVVLAGLVVGALRVTNTWDFPLYLGLVALGALIALRPCQGRAVWKGVAGAIVVAGLVFGLSGLLFQPFHDRYRLFYSGAEPSAARTAVWQFLAIHGLPLLLVTSWLFIELGRRSSLLLWGGRLPRPSAGLYSVALPLSLFELPDARWSLLVGFALLMVGLAALGQLTLALCLGIILGLSALAWLRWGSREALFQVALGLAALGALALPEVITIKGDIGRMNTVFKFYFQAWVLLGILSAAWLTRLASVGSRRADAGPGLRFAWKALLALLLGAVLVYPLRATPLKLGLRFQPSAPTLDGMAYMEQASYKDRERDVGLPDDFAALRWLQDQIEGSPVVLEANTGLYKWGSRVSIYTGLPTVIGWDWHEKQQRVAQAEAVEQRLKDVRTMYETPRLEQALPLLRKYGVVYIYVGGLERAYYPAAGLNKFAEAPGDVLETVYQRGAVTIYRLKDSPGDAAA